MRLRNALLGPVNVVVGANALMIAAITWNPLAIVLYALGAPIWLYVAATSTHEPARPSLALLERQLRGLVDETPCGTWIGRRQLPDYPAAYTRLVEMRAHTARIVATRSDAATSFEEDIVARMDDMLRAYLTLANERLLFHCSLARIYPEPPEGERGLLRRLLVAPRPPAPRALKQDPAFVSVADAMREVTQKISGFEAELARGPDQAEVYEPLLASLARRREDLAERARRDDQMAAHLRVFPDQFEIILNKLALPSTDPTHVIGAMTLLIEQTEDVARFAEDARVLSPV